ncbi:hypothetical protein Q7P37_008139 [Cladosporium fusiforme]
MSSKLIVVLGATGIQGGSVARHYASIPGWRVRGITRNPDKPSNASLRDSGIELVKADLDDPSSLDAAFQGADVIFANTDFWQFMSDPSTQQSIFSESEKSGKYPNQVAFDREIQQGKNAANAAAKISTLERYIWSTLSDTKKWTKGELVWNLHFDSKAAVADYIRSDLPELAAKTSFLQVGMYVQNWKMNPALRPAKQANGTFTMNLPKSFANMPAPFVDPTADTGLFVESLLASPVGGIMIGYSKEMPYAEFWRLWARVQGVELEILDREMDFGGLPEWLQWEFRDSFGYAVRFGFAGGDPEAKGAEAFGVDLSRTTDLEEWIRKEDWSLIL